MKLRSMLPPGWIKAEVDPNLRHFAREVAKDLREEKDCVIGITGYPGLGKSQLGSIIGMLIDENYKFDDICFIPTSDEIKKRYMGLPMYSIFHVDEASKGLHKHKWYDKVQQTLNTLYDTEREGHYICTLLLMPRFQNFAENFRNFRIKYWINIIERGLAIVYKRDEDKDAKDPWHLDENYKLKEKAWKGKRMFERNIPDLVRMEQRTKNYWFYIRIPQIPEDIWKIYQDLKAASRMIERATPELQETYAEKQRRVREVRRQKIVTLSSEGKTHIEICALLNVSLETVRRELRMVEALAGLENQPRRYDILDSPSSELGIIKPVQETMLIINQSQKAKKEKIPEEFANI